MFGRHEIASIGGALFVSLISLNALGQKPEVDPWYADKACLEAVHEVSLGRLEKAKAFASEAQRASDLDRQACGFWLMASVTETELAVLGRGSVSLKTQKSRLDALEAFAKAHPEEARFSDLAIEAKLRRVRMLLSDGSPTRAVGQARDADAGIEKAVAGSARTPTLAYALAVSNLAIAHSDWAVRTAARLAGLSGNSKIGERALRQLMASESVYQHEAYYLARTFAEAKPDGRLGPPLPYSSWLVKRYPNNPQLGFDHAVDLTDAGQSAKVPGALAPLLDKLKADPKRWGSAIRSKIYWIMGRAELANHHLSEARAWWQLAQSQVTEDTEARVDALKDALDRAEAARH